MAPILVPLGDSFQVPILARYHYVDVVAVFRDQLENPIAVHDQLAQLPSHFFKRRPRDVAKKYRELLMSKIPDQ
jgi:hypothetical protein